MREETKGRTARIKSGERGEKEDSKLRTKMHVRVYLRVDRKLHNLPVSTELKGKTTSHDL